MKNKLSTTLFRLLNKTFVLAVLIGISISFNTNANNISLANMKLTGQNTVLHYTMVTFNISWENSWRISTAAPYNWDAAWVFVKYRVNAAYGGDGVWKHAHLNTSGHNAPTGSIILPASDGTGVFIYRNADGSGTFSLTDVQLRWNYQTNYKIGTTPIGDADVADIMVYAIEMVYVPEGSFYVGDGTTTDIAAQFNVYNSSAPYQITSENVPSILGGSAPGNLRNNNGVGQEGGNDDFNNTTTKTLPAAFPKGYNAFYCMKYETSQQEYVDFLNTLTYTQQASRTPIPPNSPAGTYLQNQYRHKMKIVTPGVSPGTPAVYATDNPYVSSAYTNWFDLECYLDWSCMRMMTELEYEKACRGPGTPVANEYAWGTTSATQNTGVIVNPGLTNERSGTTGANCSYGSSPNVMGPMRTGVYATASSNRQAAGASYYGIMELSSNIYERPIPVGTATGRLYTGLHGNGEVDVNGNADVTNWPQTPDGICFRGGAWNHPLLNLRTSNRNHAANPFAPRDSDDGGRGVRTAPTFAP